MNNAQHAAIGKVLRNIADELDELALVVNSMSNHSESETLDDFYLQMVDGWYWTNEWLDEQEITDENPTRI
jgi:hypothetical protein